MDIQPVIDAVERLTREVAEMRNLAQQEKTRADMCASQLYSIREVIGDPFKERRTVGGYGWSDEYRSVADLIDQLRARVVTAA
jgi:hypothetical protein